MKNTSRACVCAKAKPMFCPGRGVKTGRSEQPHMVTRGCQVRRSPAHSICFQGNFLLLRRGGSAGRGLHPRRNGQTDGGHSLFEQVGKCSHHARKERGPGLQGQSRGGSSLKAFPTSCFHVKAFQKTLLNIIIWPSLCCAE